MSLAEDILIASLKGGIGKRARDELGRVEAGIVRKAAPVKPALSDANVDAYLCKAGFCELPPVANAAAIRAHIETLKGTLSDNRFEHFAARDLLPSPEIAAIVTDQGIIACVSTYLGAPCTVSIVTAWWSHPTTEYPVGMQHWHHDRGDFRSCNLFLYLTDVDEHSGPHMFIPGTHDSSQHTAQWLEWFDQNNRKTDAEVTRNCRPPVTFTGDAGMCFLEDTRGLHKGVIPKTASRLMFEIVYTLIPKYNEAYSPIPCPVPITDPLVKYATRLMYESAT